MSELERGTSQMTTTETHRTTTFLDLLRRQMSGVDRTRRKRTLKERLRFKCIGCCGPIRRLHQPNNTLHSPTTSSEDELETRFAPGSDIGAGASSGSGMNLATALEAERYNRGDPTEVDMTPTRVSLMRLLDETAERAVDDGRETEISTALTGNDTFCGSAIAASYLANEWVKGKAKEEVMSIKNAQVPEIAKHLSLPPVKLHCSMLPEDATKAALNDYKDTEQTVFFHISPSCLRQAMHPLQKFATRETRTILSNKLLEAVQMGTKSTVKALSSFPLLLYRCVSSIYVTFLHA
ncbi:hypothetical protein HID58_077993 [Brassica napus]|uniref:NIF system FeS cluster assembly NifU N-terminal domain-containing protein n=1 Tax=Brassica napus TaxID=3708 RepID=A0ABQ7YTM8_BRANA|nr:hypothetical protein HID58_077993 [Brassica napus]